jgi:murein DD-endopeptidase MepM/ murein hydrolase activator NlpD
VKRRRRSPSPAPAGGGTEGERKRSHLELQIHPADIRREVRYLFFSRRAVLLWGTGLTLFVAYIGFALYLSPRVVGNFLSARERSALEAERTQQGRRLHALVQRLDELYPRGRDLRTEIEKLYLAYGLPGDESMGQGGYPVTVPPVPPSKYSDSVERGQHLIADITQELQVVEAFTREIEEFQRAYGEQVRSTPSVKPLPEGSFVLTSPFGDRVSPFTERREVHAGIDLAALPGTSVFATADGVVAYAGRFPQRLSVGWWRYGNLVVIRNNDSFVTLFGHCDEIKVRQGQKVKRGDLIATVGNTGWSTSSHLHYEVRRRDGDGDFRPVDPRIYILDHRWDDQERLLIRARSAPSLTDYEPLPRLFAR